eukprot:6694534-Lingulodinium_polyedra.AAC.1
MGAYSVVRFCVARAPSGALHGRVPFSFAWAIARFLAPMGDARASWHSCPTGSWGGSAGLRFCGATG